MKMFDPIEIHTARVYPKLKIKLHNLREDTKLSTIRSTNSSKKSKQNKLHWPNNTFNIKRKIKHCWSIAESYKKRKNKWTKENSK